MWKVEEEIVEWHYQLVGLSSVLPIETIVVAAGAAAVGGGGVVVAVH